MTASEHHSVLLFLKYWIACNNQNIGLRYSSIAHTRVCNTCFILCRKITYHFITKTQNMFTVY